MALGCPLVMSRLVVLAKWDAGSLSSANDDVFYHAFVDRRNPDTWPARHAVNLESLLTLHGETSRSLDVPHHTIIFIHCYTMSQHALRDLIVVRTTPCPKTNPIEMQKTPTSRPLPHTTSFCVRTSKTQ